MEPWLLGTPPPLPISCICSDRISLCSPECLLASFLPLFIGTRPHYTGLGAWNSQGSTCFCLQSAGIKGEDHHAWLLDLAILPLAILN